MGKGQREDETFGGSEVRPQPDQRRCRGAEGRRRTTHPPKRTFGGPKEEGSGLRGARGPRRTGAGPIPPFDHAKPG